MSDKKESKLDKNVELVKLNIVAEEWRGSLFVKLGTLLSALVAISAVIVGAMYAKQLDLLSSIFAIVIVGVFIYWRASSGSKAYRKKIERLDTLISKIDNGESIGNLSELLKEKY